MFTQSLRLSFIAVFSLVLLTGCNQADNSESPLATQTLEVDKMAQQRSEEHTSELQSLMRSSYAVFCLKKKTTKINLKLTITYAVTQSNILEHMASILLSNTDT